MTSCDVCGMAGAVAMLRAALDPVTCRLRTSGTGADAGVLRITSADRVRGDVLDRADRQRLVAAGALVAVDG